VNDTPSGPRTGSRPDAVMILGATSDIARALARAYAEARHPLVLAARRAEALDRDAEDLRLRYGVTVDVVAFDLLDLATHAPLLDRFPAAETVIMVAGLLGEQPRSAADPAEAERVMKTNYVAPALFLGEAANRLERLGRGTIIGISSVAGDRGRASNYIYGSAKAGFTAFLSGLRNRMATKGVRVITVKPGFVNTRMTEGMKLPARLTAEPAEVAQAIRTSVAKGRDVVYVRPIWWPIMTVIGLVPERVFKRMKL